MAVIAMKKLAAAQLPAVALYAFDLAEPEVKYVNHAQSQDYKKEFWKIDRDHNFSSPAAETLTAPVFSGTITV